jgi:hypothetical protein
MKKTRFTEQQIAFALRRTDYNQHRPHSSLGDLTPAEFVESSIASGQPTADLQQCCRNMNNMKFA